MKHRLITALLVLTVANSAAADVRLPGLFSDSMVLQQGLPVPVWGWANPNEKIVVTLAGQDASATADKDGRWRVTIMPLKANGKPLEMTVRGKNTIVLKNVVVGEIWLCSGQSNMAMGVSYSRNAEEEIAAANFPELRIYNSRRSPSPVPMTDHQGEWLICSPANVGEWTATGYYFARHLQNQLGVPIGLINASKGSVPIQTFMSIESLKSVPTARAEATAHEKRVQDYLARRAKPNEKFSEFNHPEALYNSSILPLAPYAIRGALWYQGEGHANDVIENPDYYRLALPALIKDWRTIWGQGDFPFVVVQLPNFKRPQQLAINQGWSDFREIQCKVVESVPSAGIVTTIDIGEAFNIHPKNKQELGKRLALWALANVYEKRDVVWSGPTYKSMTIEGSKIRIRFDHVGDGLQVNGNKLTGFAIAGADKMYRFAEARLDGNDVVVWSPKVDEPVAVRYAWAENPVCNLFNKANLPAAPFRTDDWPINKVTAAEDETISSSTNQTGVR
jgi:sialate O-acetylesterase